MTCFEVRETIIPIRAYFGPARFCVDGEGTCTDVPAQLLDAMQKTMQRAIDNHPLYAFRPARMPLFGFPDESVRPLTREQRLGSKTSATINLKRIF